MGRSLSASLDYGYVISDGEGGWQLEGAGEYGEFPSTAWMDEDEDYIQEALEHRLADQNVEGVVFERAGWSFDTLLLLIKGRESLHYVQALDLPTEPPAGAEEALAKALEALGIKPTQEKPSWIIAANYG